MYVVKASLGLLLFTAYLLLALWPIALVIDFKANCYLIDNSTKSPPKKTALASPPDFRFLLERSMAGTVVTEAQLAEERDVEAEQVEQARLWLSDADAAQRLIGAEQLSAYPSQEAEKYLLAALTGDDNAEVRAAAAGSLAAFKEPSGKVFDGLLTALRDNDENVRFNAWSSLEILLNKPELPTKTIKKVQSELARLVKKGRLVGETRDVIREYLRDQQGG